MKIPLVFTKIGTLSLVFLLCLLCLLCLQSDGADIAGGCTGDENCTNTNGACINSTCDCVATHYYNGSVCTQKKPPGVTCTQVGLGTECVDNAVCQTVSSDKKCTCTSDFYANGGICVAKIGVNKICNSTGPANQCKDLMSTCIDVSGTDKCTCNTGYYNNDGTCTNLTGLKVQNLDVPDVTTGETFFVVKWTKPSTVSFIDKYQLILVFNNQSEISVDIDKNNTNYNISNREPGRTYTIILRSVEAQTRPTQQTTDVIITGGTRPAIPGEIIQSEFNGPTINISWTITGDLVYLSGTINDTTASPSTFNLTFASQLPLLSVTNMRHGDHYTFTVISHSNGFSSAAYSETIRTRPIRPPPPTVFACIDNNIFDRSMILTWKEPAVPNGYIQNYIIYDMTRNKQITTNGSVLEQEIDGLTPEQYYYFNITTVNDAATDGESSQSNQITCRTKPDLSTPPQNVVANAVTSNKITVQWDDPKDPGGILWGYRIHVKNETDGTCVQEIMFQCVSGCAGVQNLNYMYNCIKEITLNTTSTKMNQTMSYDIEDLLPYVNYEVTIQAVNAAGNGNTADISNTTAEEVPKEPLQVTGDAQTDPKTLLVTWEQLLPRPGITNYTVKVYEENDDATEFVYKESFKKEVLGYYNQNATIDGLEEYWNYKFVIVAATSIGFVESNMTTAVRTRHSAPGKVVNFTIRNPSEIYNQIDVMWSIPLIRERNSVIEKYVISHNISGNMESLNVSASSDSVMKTFNVTAEQSYEVEVYAVNTQNQMGSKSIKIHYAEPGLSSPPQNVVSSAITSNNITVQWDYPQNPGGVQLWGYRITVRNGTNDSICVQEIIFQCVNGCPNAQNLGFKGSCDSKKILNTSTLQTMSHDIEELLPYVNYKIIIQAVNAKGEGHFAEVENTTLEEAPKKPLQVTGVAQTDPRTLQVTWQQPLPRPGITNYTVKVYEENDDATEFVHKEGLKNEISGYYNQTATINGLEEYWNYTFVIVATTSIGSVESDMSPVVRTRHSAPGDVANFMIRNISEIYNQMIVTWNIPPIRKRNSVIMKYVISHNISGNMESLNVTESSDSFMKTFNVTAEQSYEVEVYAVNTQDQEGPTSNKIYYAKPGLSSPPQNVVSSAITSNNITVQWDYPQNPGGVQLWGYRITVRNGTNDSICVQEIIFQCVNGCPNAQNLGFKGSCDSKKILNASTANMLQTMSHDIEDLLPYVNYKIIIQAVNAKGEGHVAEVENTTLEEAPKKPLQVTGVPQSDPKTLQVTWQQPLPRPGITTYTVKVYEENDDETEFVYKKNFTEEIPGYYNQTATIDGLEEYWNYTFVIVAATSIGSVESNMTTAVRTRHSAPGKVVNFTIRNPSEIYNQMNVMWSIPPIRKRNSVIMKYVISHNISGNMESLNVTESSDSFMKTFNVTAEQSYEVEVYAVNTQDQEGPTSNKIYYAKPGLSSPPQNVVSSAITSNNITVQWDYPQNPGGVQLWGYRITVRNGTNDSICVQEIIFQCVNGCPNAQNLGFKGSCDSKKILNASTANMLQTMSHDIEDLLPYVNYKIIIQAVNAKGEGHVAEVENTTLEEAPKKPLQVTGVPQSDPKTLQVTWQQPLPRPGITTYTVKVYEENDDETEFVYKKNFTEEIPGYYNQTATIDGLEEYWNYTFVIVAATSIGSVESNMTTAVRTRHSAPGKVVNFTIRNPSEIYNQMNVMWSIPPIRKRNSVIMKYVISHNISGNMESLNVTESSDSFMKTFKVTAEQSYEVEVYAVNTQDQEGPTSNKIYYAKPGLPDDPRTGIIAGAVAAVVVVIIVIVIIAVFVMHRRNRQKPKEKELDDKPMGLQAPSVERKNIQINKQKPTKKLMDNAPVPVVPSDNRPIVMEDFERAVEDLHKDSNLKFAHEYEELKTLTNPKTLKGVTTNLARTEEHKLKNRYVNILPYDESIVPLASLADDDENATTFINANYIPGYRSQREYIASQGPIPSTIDDFWRMIWEQSVAIVVMLTLCKEQGRIKCECYWPTELRDPKKYREIVVELTSCSTLNTYEIRVFKLTMGNTTRYVKHFHFLNWKDFSANVQNDVMIDFIHNVRSHVRIPESKVPMIVHCSAGVGRTGTYIAIDHLMQFVNDHDFSKSIDIFNIVVKMRQCRMYMVQTEQQYIFIYDCIRDILEKRRLREQQNNEENLYENPNVKEEDLYDNNDFIYENNAFVHEPEADLVYNVIDLQSTEERSDL